MVFSFGGGARTTGLAGSLSSFSSWARCFSTPVKACLLEGAGVLAAGSRLADPDMAGSKDLTCCLAAWLTPEQHLHRGVIHP